MRLSPGPFGLLTASVLALCLLPDLAGATDAAPSDPAVAGDGQSLAPRSARDFMTKILDLPPDNIVGALADEDRPAEDRGRDATEKTEALLKASGIARGWSVADVQAGDGFLAQVMMPAVKRFGHVWANNDPALLDAATAKAWEKRLDDPSTADIATTASPIDAAIPLHIPPVNLVFHHDAYHAAISHGVDRAKMNAAIFDALASGGRYVVIDARADDNTAPDAAARLCRSSETFVKKEVEAAGFRLVSASDVLRDSGDGANACGAVAPGKSRDRYLMVFEKP